MTNNHLTEEQFSDLLIEPEQTGAAALHLSSCAVCRDELDALRSSIGSFNAVTLAWSERRSVTRPSSFPVKARAGWRSGLAWSVALMTILSVGVAVQTSRHGGSSDVTMQAEGSFDQNSEAAIKRDNELMKAVSQELARKEPFPLLADSVTEAGSGRGERKQVEATIE